MVVLVWLAHDTCRLLQEQIETLPPLPVKPGVSSTGPANGAQPLPHRDVICRLLRLWDLLGLCIGTFALAVVAAIVTASSLRAAFLEAHPDRAEEFPAVNVLYFGVLFAALASDGEPVAAAAHRADCRWRETRPVGVAGQETPGVGPDPW
jgi:hypothetical protein